MSNEVPKVAQFNVRLGGVLMWLSYGLFFLSWGFPGRAAPTAILASGLVMTLGFVLLIIEDFRVKKTFNYWRLLGFLFVAFVMAVFGPVLAAAGH